MSAARKPIRARLSLAEERDAREAAAGRGLTLGAWARQALVAQAAADIAAQRASLRSAGEPR